MCKSFIGMKLWCDFTSLNKHLLLDFLPSGVACVLLRFHAVFDIDYEVDSGGAGARRGFSAGCVGSEHISIRARSFVSCVHGFGIRIG